ncbi:MAG: bifunctional aspartate kinase/diaminopimelate decarboxylase [Gammaproteobacteria bacterium]|nr:bifunctional aspartate kinase/diaminopimelate decarboxylase [Gammaproteobacteria bacterium]
MTASANWVVAKFGGTSVSAQLSLNNMAQLVARQRQSKHKVLVVVSALSGVSNRLEQLSQSPEAVNIDELCDLLVLQHRKLLDTLALAPETLASVSTKVEAKIAELKPLHEQLLVDESPSFYSTQARIMAMGEQFSSLIIHAFLEQSLQHNVALIDAREWLTAEPSEQRGVADRYLNAECLAVPDEQAAAALAQHGDVLITQGFIASNRCGETVVLGRGGSDTSAAYFAAMLGASRLEIWTDVPGMFSGNPRQIPEARQLTQLDYREAQEIASTGAKVLHPRCLRPARQASIPVFVGSAFDIDKGGTLISHLRQAEPQVKAISVREGVLLIAMETSDMWQRPGFLAEAFNIFAKHGLSIDQVSTSETNVTVTLDNLTQGISSRRIQALVEELQSICRVTVLENCSAVSIVGRSIRMLLSQLSHAFEVFKNRSVHMLTQAANNLNFTFVIEQSEAGQLVKQLHDNLISQRRESEQLGATWSELFGVVDSQATELAKNSWWFNQVAALEGIAAEHGPCYVYSREKVEQQLDKLRSMAAVDRLFFAMKANSNADLLRWVEAKGFGFECVSINEVRYLLQQFPQLQRQRILFTPNFAPRSEYQEALELGVHLTLDNLFPLKQWGEMFAGQSLFLRIDTGTGRGHHQHVKTAGAEAKFGIPVADAMAAKALFDSHNIRIVGLHCHVGSGILSADNWYENGQVLQQLVEHFAEVKYMDLGGGLGVVEKPQQTALDLAQVDVSLANLKAALPGVELWLEPGRFVCAESGVLLARVTQLKGKQGARYLGVETGMNSLIRPALYGAYHPIVNLSRLNAPARERYTVVGPICETGDKLGVDRLLPESHEGDVMLIGNTGAYGFVMASQYNMRAPAREFIFENLVK